MIAAVSVAVVIIIARTGGSCPRLPAQRRRNRLCDLRAPEPGASRAGRGQASWRRTPSGCSSSTSWRRGCALARSGSHIVKVARVAGQFAKPRSASMETVDGVELPVYRGEMVNAVEADPASRVADQQRMGRRADAGARRGAHRVLVGDQQPRRLQARPKRDRRRGGAAVRAAEPRPGPRQADDDLAEVAESSSA